MQGGQEMRSKKLWLILSSMIVAVLILTSCGEAVTEEDEDETKYGGTLRIAYTPDQFSLDPPLLSGAADILVVHQAYECLTESE
jgi:ABC-type oligopeptide transport system substrate-binding subunit